MMAYTQQIRILEAKLKQLQKGQQNEKNIQSAWEIESNLRRLKRLEWEENHERIKMEEDR
jgi:ubiquinone biosynthesis protein Coq4